MLKNESEIENSGYSVPIRRPKGDVRKVYWIVGAAEIHGAINVAVIRVYGELKFPVGQCRIDPFGIVRPSRMISELYDSPSSSNGVMVTTMV